MNCMLVLVHPFQVVRFIIGRKDADFNQVLGSDASFYNREILYKRISCILNFSLAGTGNMDIFLFSVMFFRDRPPGLL